MTKARQTLAKDAADSFWPEVPRPLLQGLHLLDRNGAIQADAHRKLKQVKHLLQLVAPAVVDALARHPRPVVVDFGAGKSYLGLLLAQTLLKPETRGQVLAVESREELVQSTATVAEQSGLGGLVRCQAGQIESATLPERVHLVTALHACDTATDDALVRAIRAQADHIAVVPCCQAELAQLLKTTPPPTPWRELCHHALHRREFGSQLTNVLRGLVLEAHGYQVSVTELVGWEHSLKNELLLARRVHRENAAARQRLGELLAAVGVQPKLVRVLGAGSAGP